MLQESLAARLPGPIHALRHSTDDVAPPRFPAQTGVAQRPDGGGVPDVGRKTGDVQLMGYRPAPLVADRGQLRVEPALSVPQFPAARVLPLSAGPPRHPLRQAGLGPFQQAEGPPAAQDRSAPDEVAAELGELTNERVEVRPLPFRGRASEKAVERKPRRDGDDGTGSGAGLLQVLPQLRHGPLQPLAAGQEDAARLHLVPFEVDL